jgi:glutathione S-transferase
LKIKSIQKENDHIRCICYLHYPFWQRKFTRKSNATINKKKRPYQLHLLTAKHSNIDRQHGRNMTIPNVIIYAIPGSQFVFKVLAALQSRNIPHYIKDVPIDATSRRKVIPSGGLLVPELQVGLSKTNRIIVTDSEKILHWFDDNMETNFFLSNSSNVCELSERASTKTLAGMVWYYNWVNVNGYKNSMQRTIVTSKLPSFIFCFREAIVDYAVRAIRTKHRRLAASALEIQDENQLDDEDLMYTKLVTELKYFQELLQTDEQVYLIPNDKPSAVDLSVYAQVERLVGNGGDIEIFAAVPQLLDNPDLQRLWKWYKHMKETIPVQFKGKRLPQDINSELFS